MEYTLRTWQENDVESLIKHANNPKIAQFMTDAFPYPYTEEKGKAFIKYALTGNPTNIFAIEVEGNAVGGIGIHPQLDVMCKNAELGYWLSEQYWGRGIITNAIQEMVNYAFEKFDIIRIYARPYGNNIASQKALLKARFVLEANIQKSIFKNGELLDEMIFAYRKNK